LGLKESCFAEATEGEATWIGWLRGVIVVVVRVAAPRVSMAVVMPSLSSADLAVRWRQGPMNASPQSPWGWNCLASATHSSSRLCHSAHAPPSPCRSYPCPPRYFCGQTPLPSAPSALKCFVISDGLFVWTETCRGRVALSVDAFDLVGRPIINGCG
jgi:hypothetical protein